MLHAYLERKLARSLSINEEEGLRHEALAARLRHHEDPLTAMVFGRLAYLRAETAWRIVVDAATTVRGAKPALSGAEFEQLFWPHLAPLTTGERLYVEPDVIWSWANLRAAVVFEVKWHERQQVNQLDQEWEAARRHFGRETNLTLVAVGGGDPVDWSIWKTACRADNLLAITWRNLWDAVAREEGREPEPHQRRLLLDLLSIFRDRGLETSWLTSLPGWRCDAQSLSGCWCPAGLDSETERQPSLATLPATLIDLAALTSLRPHERFPE